MGWLERRKPAVLLVATSLGFCTAAGGQEPTQTLDRVQVNSRDAVLEMNFDDPRRLADFANTGITGSTFSDCTLAALGGLYCLDSQSVRHWADPGDPGSFEIAVACGDPTLGLNSRKGDACTALTVDLAETLWLGGTTRRAHSLIRVVKKRSTGCPAGFEPLSMTAWCADVVVSETGRLDDLNPIDGDAAAGFDHGKGILALADGDSAIFFPDGGGTPIEIASGKRDWNLQRKERLLGITLLQIADDSGSIENLVLATTSGSRILAAAADGSGSAIEAFDIPANREPTSVQCDFNGAAYGIRASSKSGLVYVTDREYCEVIALRPVADASGRFVQLVNATEPEFDQAGGPTGDERNLTLSTADASGTHPPLGATVAPGISIDLDDCAGFCPLVLGADGDAAASLSNVSIASQASGLTLFQVRNIPDCRYLPQVCRELLGTTDLVGDGVVVNLPGNIDNPAGQLLNLTPLLPRDIAELFDDSDEPPAGLPPMYMSRQYRGQKANNFRFDAFFGVTADGVVFDDVFNGEFDVEALVGTSLGCALGLSPGTPLETVLQWDTVTTVSETYVSVDGRYIDTLINTDCGSSRTSSTRWSIVPYNTEIVPCTHNGDPSDVWVSDGSCPVNGPETPDDAVFAKLLLSLYDDLGASLNQLACNDVDGAGSAPLSASSCASLDATWKNGKDKLDKCWNATQDPKQSSGEQNCQAFLSQLQGLRTSFAAVPLLGPDPANRKSELRARVEVIFHVYAERFVPSLPAAGFVEP